MTYWTALVHLTAINLNYININTVNLLVVMLSKVINENVMAVGDDELSSW